MLIKKRYVITLVIGLLISLFVCYIRNIFHQTDRIIIVHILSDATLISGVVLLGLGLLIFVSNNGIFDGINYSYRRFGSMISTDTEKKKNFPSFYDYKEEKSEKLKDFGFLLIIGGVFILTSVIFLLIYNSMT